MSDKWQKWYKERSGKARQWNSRPSKQTQTLSPSRTKLFPTVVLASSRSIASMYSFIPRKLPTASSGFAVSTGFALAVVPGDVEDFLLADIAGLPATGGLDDCGLDGMLWGLGCDLLAEDVGFLFFWVRGEQYMSPSSSSDSYSSMSELDALSASSNSTSHIDTHVTYISAAVLTTQWCQKRRLLTSEGQIQNGL